MTDDTDMTEENDTLGGMSHTNPYTGRVFGDTQTYSRGNAIAADGGEADAVDGTETSGDDPDRLADVSHAPPDETPGAQRAYDRGVDHE